MRIRSMIVMFFRLLVVSGSMLAAACNDGDLVFNPGTAPFVVHGNGSVIEQIHEVSGIRRVNLQGVGTLRIRQGAQEGLVIRAESNLMEHLFNDVRGDELLIRKDAVTLLNTRPIEYDLTVVTLDRAALTGAGSIQGADLVTGPLSLLVSGVGAIEFANLSAPSVDVRSSGLDGVTLSGSVDQQTIELRGMGDYNGRDLESLEADVFHFGMGPAIVRVRDQLDVAIHGSGSVYYIGDPVIDSNISGSGNLVQIGG